MDGSQHEEASAGFDAAGAVYLAEDFKGRLAISSQHGRPHLVPVGHRLDRMTTIPGDWRLERTPKHMYMMHNHKVAFVVEDHESSGAWSPTGMGARAKAQPVMAREGVSMVRTIPLNIRNRGLGS